MKDKRFLKKKLVRDEPGKGKKKGKRLFLKLVYKKKFTFKTKLAKKGSDYLNIMLFMLFSCYFFVVVFLDQFNKIIFIFILCMYLSFFFYHQ